MGVGYCPISGIHSFGTENVVIRVLKDGDSMKALAEHHWSPEFLLTVSIIVGLALGAIVGLLIGNTMDNIGVGVSIGAIAGLIVGLSAGIIMSGREE